MKLSATKFNEKNVFRQLQKKKKILRYQLYARAVYERYAPDYAEDKHGLQTTNLNNLGQSFQDP